MCTVIYKVGGSLLSLPDLSRRLCSVLEQPVSFAGATRHERVKPLLVVGGGLVADVVRNWDEVHKLGDERAHDLALRSMSFNAHLVASVLKQARVVASRAEAAAAWSERKIAVLAAAEFVDQEENASRDLLPRSWDVTSDSIAAYVALRWPVAVLVLLKSTALQACDPWAAARQGLVDSYFPGLAARVRTIGWANLRDAEPTIQPWIATAGV
jgi:5-(aminomethyl)-3-furanmethanol phosphate kinase